LIDTFYLWEYFLIFSRSPEYGLPDAVKKSLQALWANNGDTISKQYAGTSALKVACSVIYFKILGIIPVRIIYRETIQELGKEG